MTARPAPPYSRSEQIADMTVHAIGVLGALAGVPVLITLAAIGEHSEGAFIAAVAVYGASLMIMLGVSAGLVGSCGVLMVCVDGTSAQPRAVLERGCGIGRRILA